MIPLAQLSMILEITRPRFYQFKEKASVATAPGSGFRATYLSNWWLRYVAKRPISGLNPSKEITCLKTDEASCHSISSLNFLYFQSAVVICAWGEAYSNP